MKKSPTRLVIIAVITAAAGFIPRFTPFGFWALGLWIFLLVFTFLFFAELGVVIAGRVGGVLIDGRNRMSLSRLQISMWTIVVVSAMIAAAYSNIHMPSVWHQYTVDPMRLQLPPEIWLALGISATSLAATPLILAGKASNMHRNPDPTAASFTDLFQGDDVGNAGSIDLSKVQMFYFTLILVVGYAFAIGKMFVHGAVPTPADKPLFYGYNDFPALSAAAVTLLGISHGGYLGFKAMPQASPPASSDHDAAAPAPTPESDPGPLVDTYAPVAEPPFEGGTSAA
ncbi:MAG: hypothetical protein ACLQVD_11915 [Capsulimonadaceae bacterium]